MSGFRKPRAKANPDILSIKLLKYLLQKVTRLLSLFITQFENMIFFRLEKIMAVLFLQSRKNEPFKMLKILLSSLQDFQSGRDLAGWKRGSIIFSIRESWSA